MKGGKARIEEASCTWKRGGTS